VRLPPGLGVALALVLAAVTTRTRAVEPADYVLTPGVVYGERAIDTKIGTASGPGPRDSAGSVAFEYSPTSWWVTELYAEYARAGGTGTQFDGIEWENRFQLSEPGEYAVDWGGVVEVEKPHQAGSGWNLTLGPLIQGALADRIQWNINPLLSRNLGGPSGAATQTNINSLLPSNLGRPNGAATQMGYQMQVKYRYREAFEFGAQGFGDLGPFYHWSPLQQQTHRFGPAVFGRIPIEGRRVLYYNAGYLFGLVSHAPSDTVRAQVELEF
jgi:hypothetical protein